MELWDLYELFTKVTRYEFLKEEAYKKSSSYGIYYQEYEDPGLELEVDVTTFLG